jgi:hypothetical protein
MLRCDCATTGFWCAVASKSFWRAAGALFPRGRLQIDILEFKVLRFAAACSPPVHLNPPTAKKLETPWTLRCI